MRYDHRRLLARIVGWMGHTVNTIQERFKWSGQRPAMEWFVVDSRLLYGRMGLRINQIRRISEYDIANTINGRLRCWLSKMETLSRGYAEAMRIRFAI